MKLEKSEPHHKKKAVIFWGKFIKILTIKFIVFSALVLFFLYFGVSYAQAPIKALVAQITKPKPITQSSTALPQSIQQAIENLAAREIKIESANATLPVNVSDDNLNQASVGLLDELFAANPAEKAKIRIKKIDKQIANLRNLLTKDKSDKTIKEAVGLIKEIGKAADTNARDKAVLGDRELLGLQNAQYIRLQLILQQIEDTLPMKDYLVIEDARQKYLVVNAATLIDNAPNIEVVFATGIGEVTNVVGEDFTELKAMEFIADFEDRVSPQAKQKLLGLEKGIAASFEKRMLKLPGDVRNRKLQSYIHYSFGDPLLQIRSFNRMKDNLTDRELITGVDSLKEVAIKRLTDRVFELNSQEDLDAYVDWVIQRPQDIKILGEMQLAINSGRDLKKIKKLVRMEQSVSGRIARFFNTATPDQLQSFFTPNEGAPTDLMDVVMINNLETMVNVSPDVSQDIKKQFVQAKNKALERFVTQIGSRDFQTANADVRILLSSPQGIAILQNLRTQVASNQRAAIDRAIIANAKIVEEHLLFQINDTEIFTDYEFYITQNKEVNQVLQRYVGRNFTENLAKKSLVVQKVALDGKQQLYEIMQQITQTLFAGQNNTELLKQLPDNIRREVQTLKRTLPARNIPKLTVPQGVTLPAIATLPHSVQHAIVQAAKARIRDGQKSEALKLDFTLTATDLDIAKPNVLPGNLLYPLKTLVRKAELLLAFNPLDRAETLVRHNNERTLEAALLLEANASRKNIDLSLQTLAEVQQNFDLLKKNTAGKSLPSGGQVDRLINSIIKNGLARQTVFALIEDKVYGADYVRVEKIRQAVLKDGIESLLQLSNGDAQILVEKLEKAVNSGQGSQFKELKAIELLIEIKRFQPKEIGVILAASSTRLVKQFETKILAMKKEDRERELLAYAKGLPGNPVRQFESYEELKEGFENKETIALVQGLEDQAVKNLTEIVSGITDNQTLQEFAREVVGNELGDLEVILAVEQQIDTTDAPGTGQTLIEQQIEDIKIVVEEQVAQDLLANPESVIEAGINLDSTTAEELIVIIEQSPDASSEVISAIEELAVQEEQVVSEETQVVQDTTSDLTQEEVLLEETVAQIQEEIFTAPVSDPSTVETTLTEPVQEDLTQIKEEVSSEQLLEETVSTTDTTVTTIEEVQTTVETTSEPVTTSTETTTTTAVEETTAPSTETTLPGL